MVNLCQRFTSVDSCEVVSRSGGYAHIGPVDIAQVYPKGAKKFDPDWEGLRSSRPPSGDIGPRLIVVALDIDEGALPVSSMLSERVQLLSAPILDTSGMCQVPIEACRKKESGPSADKTVEFLPAPDVGSDRKTEPCRRGRVREAQEFQPTLTAPATPRFTAFPGHIDSQDDADVIDPAQTLIVETAEAPPTEQPQPADAEAGDRSTDRRLQHLTHRERGQGAVREDERPDRQQDQQTDRSAQEDPFNQVKIPVILAWRAIEDGVGETPTHISARYDQEVKRPYTGQPLWGKSAPKRDRKRRQPQTFSKAAAANMSSNAVARAAERELLTPAGRLVAIVGRSVMPLTLGIWKNGSPTMATLTSTGTLLLGHASYQDPSKTTAEVLGKNDVNG